MSGITLKLPERDCALHCFRNDIESRSIIAPTLVFQDGKTVRAEEYYMSKYQVGKLPYDVTRVQKWQACRLWHSTRVGASVR